ncbi:hypothetical protein LWF01_14445 [Saxibacter everestensis]|uniref:Uncharacterized protein n=1 Tax=Saxibacter everestensis TaxID=2909229 RepID=A0ABY8QQM3_9MICO|nr:hypothetical protein LWF01_14445 [Brevibacteriaceae bacterium ZFBP1038]
MLTTIISRFGGTVDGDTILGDCLCSADGNCDVHEDYDRRDYFVSAAA